MEAELRRYIKYDVTRYSIDTSALQRNSRYGIVTSRSARPRCGQRYIMCYIRYIRYISVTAHFMLQPVTASVTAQVVCNAERRPGLVWLRNRWYVTPRDFLHCCRCILPQQQRFPDSHLIGNPHSFAPLNSAPRRPWAVTADTAADTLDTSDPSVRT